jgi:hypothetical protein
MVTMPSLGFPDWSKEFHVHVDASSIALGAVLAQPGEGDIDHPLSFASRKISTAEFNYTTTERGTTHGVCTAKILPLLVGRTL